MDKIERGNPLTQSADIVKENLETLKRLFPTIVKEGKIDVDELKALIDDDVETSEEYYRFTWAGKSEARREANKPSTGTLRPNKADSKDWDTTGNIFIEGDNLEVLKLLQKSYAGKIKMMYFDPPYNTGKDFVYKDNYADNLGNYLAMSKQTDDEGNKLSTNTESDGRYHSNWLNMMYPRLKLSHNLLKENGVIFISIDDNEVFNLRKLLDEIFGEENFVADIIWNSTKSVTNTALISVSHTHNLVYFKDIKYFVKNRTEFRLPEDGEGFSNPDNDPRGNWKADPFQVGGWRPNQQYEIINPLTGESYYPNTDCSWKNDLNKFQELLNDNRIVFGATGEAGPQRKRFLSEALERGKVTKTLWDDIGTTTNGTQTFKKLFEGKALFTNPKPVDLIERMLQLSTNSKKTHIVLDIFSGSATTSHAVMNLNKEDGGNRKFICVQLPEATDEKSEANKAGYKNIADISKERIRRAGAKIISDKTAELEKLQSSIKGKILLEDIQSQIESLKSTINKLDTGFKAFKLDSSNINSWDGSVENFEANLFNAQNNIKDDRTEEDVLFEILLKYGLDLTVPIQEKAVGKCKVYSIGAGVLFICLSDNITTEVAKAIGEWKKELEPATCRVLFKDNGFIDDVAKTNSVQILRQYGIEECNSI